jgi:tRNA threonylcarbamoyl adenosine modification protein (Sua5/YciO/YrdC/YwlC family)
MLVLACDHVKPKAIHRAVEVLRSGGVVVYPTDTVYGMGCDLLNPRAIDKVYQIKKIPRKKPLSFICADLSQISQYAQVSNSAYKLMRHLLPGPYTFILQATRLVPRVMMTRQRTVGIRVPDNEICLSLVRALGHPLVNTSASTSEDEVVSDPEAIQALFPQVDLLLDAGLLKSEPSTILDLTTDPPTVVRQGKGDVAAILQV